MRTQSSSTALQANNETGFAHARKRTPSNGRGRDKRLASRANAERKLFVRQRPSDAVRLPEAVCERSEAGRKVSQATPPTAPAAAGRRRRVRARAGRAMRALR